MVFYFVVKYCWKLSFYFLEIHVLQYSTYTYFFGLNHCNDGESNHRLLDDNWCSID